MTNGQIRTDTGLRGIVAAAILATLAAGLLLGAVPLALADDPAPADPLADLIARVDAHEQRIADLERQVAALTPRAPEPPAQADDGWGPLVGSWMMSLNGKPRGLVIMRQGGTMKFLHTDDQTWSESRGRVRWAFYGGVAIMRRSKTPGVLTGRVIWGGNESTIRAVRQ